LAEKSESETTLLEARLVKIESLLSVSINKIACLEAEINLFRDQVVKY